MLHLEGYPAYVSGNDWSSCVLSFGHLDFEALACWQLKDDIGVGEKEVEHLVVRVEGHERDSSKEVRILRVNLLHSLVVDASRIWVIRGTVAVSADVISVSNRSRLVNYSHLYHKLRWVFHPLFLALSSELAVRVDDRRDALCRIEPGYLNKVFPAAPVDLGLVLR
jgi:hypothetical protein